MKTRNTSRAVSALITLRQQPGYLSEGVEVAAVDLLTNICHLIGPQRFAECVRLSLGHYDSEMAQEKETEDEKNL